MHLSPAHLLFVTRCILIQCLSIHGWIIELRLLIIQRLLKIFFLHSTHCHKDDRSTQGTQNCWDPADLQHNLLCSQWDSIDWAQPIHQAQAWLFHYRTECVVNSQQGGQGLCNKWFNRASVIMPMSDCCEDCIALQFSSKNQLCMRGWLWLLFYSTDILKSWQGKKKTCCDLFIVCLQYCLLLIYYVF